MGPQQGDQPSSSRVSSLLTADEVEDHTSTDFFVTGDHGTIEPGYTGDPSSIWSPLVPHQGPEGVQLATRDLHAHERLPEELGRDHWSPAQQQLHPASTVIQAITPAEQTVLWPQDGLPAQTMLPPQRPATQQQLHPAGAPIRLTTPVGSQDVPWPQRLAQQQLHLAGGPIPAITPAGSQDVPQPQYVVPSLEAQAMLPPPRPRVAGSQASPQRHRARPMEDRDAAMTRLADDREQARHDSRCRQLGHALVQAWNNAGNDQPLAKLMTERYAILPQHDKPSRKHITVTSEAFFQATFYNMDARGTLMWLLVAEWDVETALRAYMAQRFQTDGSPGSEIIPRARRGERPWTSVEESGAESSFEDESDSEQEVVEVYVDEDPDNIGNIPQEIQIERYAHPGTGKRVMAVRHESIRGYLLNQAAMKGHYKYGREQWPENDAATDDMTSFLQAQRRWGFNTREQYPPIIFLFQRMNRQDPIYPNDRIPNMRWRGLLVIDRNGVPVRRFRNIPATLSSQAEGGLMEAIRREDSRIKNKDLVARMPRKWTRRMEYPGQAETTTMEMDQNTLASRTTRFREEAGCINWYGRPSAIKRYDRYLLDNLPQPLKDANSTRGMARNFVRREWELMNQSHALQTVAVRIGLVPEFAVGADGKAKSFYHPDEEHDCRECRPQGLQDLAALNDALLITVTHFMELTGKCPRLPMRRMTYRQFLAVIEEQLRNEPTGRRLGQREPLRHIGKWTGGIARWRSGAVMEP